MTPGLQEWLTCVDLPDKSAGRACLTRRFFARISMDMDLDRQGLVIESLAHDAHVTFSRTVAATLNLADHECLLQDLWQPFALWFFTSLAAGRHAPLDHFHDGPADCEVEACGNRDTHQHEAFPWESRTRDRVLQDQDCSEVAHPLALRVEELLGALLPASIDAVPPRLPAARAHSELARSPRRHRASTAASRESADRVPRSRQRHPPGCWWDPFREPLQRLIQIEGLNQFRRDRFWSGAFISSPVGRILRANRVAEVRSCEVRTIDRCTGQSRFRVLSGSAATGPAREWQAVRCGHSHAFLRNAACACPTCQSSPEPVSRRLRWLVSVDAPGEYVQRWTCTRCGRIGGVACPCPECGVLPRRLEVFVPGEVLRLDQPSAGRENARPLHETLIAREQLPDLHRHTDMLNQLVERVIADLLGKVERDIGGSLSKKQTAVNRLLALVALLPLLAEARRGLPKGWQMEFLFNLMADEPPAAAIERAELTCCDLGFQPPPVGDLPRLQAGNYAVLKFRLRAELRSRLAAAMA